jgi:hypothetical protein
VPQGEHVTLKMLRRTSKTQFENQDAKNAIALLNYSKRIAPQH